MTTHRSDPSSPEAIDLVLLSGGIDSAALAVALAAAGSGLRLLFIDYGQPACRSERAAAGSLGLHLGLALAVLRVEGLDIAEGEIHGRNALLVHLALTTGIRVGALHIGIHAGTGYRDCSPAFVEVMQSSLDLHCDGRLRLSAPLLAMNKAESVAFARDVGLPFELTYSCERADGPCNLCRSCRDREVLLAS
jgi:7-cyano-7-deazaguanine synthase